MKRKANKEIVQEVFDIISGEFTISDFEILIAEKYPERVKSISKIIHNQGFKHQLPEGSLVRVRGGGSPVVYRKEIDNKPKREEKSIEERELDMVATAIANSTISSIKAAAVWMPDELHTYKEGYLLKFVIEKLQNSF